jgi:hypothetical protein
MGTEAEERAPGVGEGVWAGSSVAAAASAHECGRSRPVARLELRHGASTCWIENQGVRAGEERERRPSLLELEQRKEGREGAPPPAASASERPAPPQIEAW